MTGNYEEFGDSVRKKDFFFNWASLKFEDLLNYNILGTEQDRVTHDRVWYDPNAWHVRGHGHGFGSDPKTGPGKREGGSGGEPRLLRSSDRASKNGRRYGKLVRDDESDEH